MSSNLHLIRWGTGGGGGHRRACELCDGLSAPCSAKHGARGTAYAPNPPRAQTSSGAPWLLTNHSCQPRPLAEASGGRAAGSGVAFGALRCPATAVIPSNTFCSQFGLHCSMVTASAASLSSSPRLGAGSVCALSLRCPPPPLRLRRRHRQRPPRCPRARRTPASAKASSASPHA